MSNWDYESISLTNKQQSLMMYVFESFIKFPYLLEDFNLHRKELKDINGRYVTTTMLHNEEISDIYDTLKEQVSGNIKTENTLIRFAKLSPEDQSKVLTKAAQLKETN